MRVIFVNRYFYPDASATSQILTDLAFVLPGKGFRTAVIASRLNYIDTSVSYPSRERVNGVNVHRIWSSRFGRSSLVGRAVDYLTFYFSVFWYALFHVSRGDIVVAKTDPPLVSVLIGLVCFIRRARLVNWLQDLFPEVGEAAGIGVLSGASARLIRWLRNLNLRAASCNVVIGERMLELVTSQGVNKDTIRVIHNWSVTPGEAPGDDVLERYLDEWALRGKFVIGYSGNFGRAHDYITILSAIEACREMDDLVFLFVGGGVYYRNLLKYAGENALHNVIFKPYQPRKDLAATLSIPDVHLITLEPGMEGLVVPSKFYGIIRAGRPSIFVGDPEGEIAQLVRRYDCGIAVESNDVEGLVAAIRSLMQDAQRKRELGVNARDVSERCFGKLSAIDKWVVLLRDVGAGQVAPENTDAIQNDR